MWWFHILFLPIAILFLAVRVLMVPFETFIPPPVEHRITSGLGNDNVFDINTTLKKKTPEQQFKSRSISLLPSARCLDKKTFTFDYEILFE